MNPAQLLTHFHRLAEAPDAIPRLRRFILDLAVRGRLVAQNPKDEPAAKLLSESDRVRKETSKIDRRADEEHQTLLAEEHCWSVPHSWEWRGLADLVLFIDYRGQTPNKTASGVRLITAKNVKNGFLSLSPEEFLADADYAKWMTRGIPAVGDVLFTTEAPMGNAAVVRLTERFALAQRVINFRPYGSLDSEFLKLQLIAPPFQFILGKAGTGMTAKGIKASKLKCLPIAVPPLAEQRRIVAKVDELMALCDRLEAAQEERERRRERLVAATHAGLTTSDPLHSSFVIRHFPLLATSPDQIPQLRQTILNLAVRGQLVPQNPKDEPAVELFKRLCFQLAKCRAQEGTRSRKETLLSAVNFFSSDCFPASWVVTNFDSVNAIASGVAKGKDLRGVKTSAYPYLRVANVQRGHLNLTVVKEIEIRVDEFDRYELRRGDVLMTEGGDWDKLGRAAIWSEEIPNCIHQNHIYRIRSASLHELLPTWIMLFANSPLGRSYFEGASKQTTNLASINMTQLRSCPLPLPPLAEQQRIVAKVAELMALCDRLEAQLSATQTGRRRLLDAVLHEALAA